MKVFSYLAKNGEFKYPTGSLFGREITVLNRILDYFKKSNHISFAISKSKMINSREYIYFRKELSKS